MKIALISFALLFAVGLAHISLLEKDDIKSITYGFYLDIDNVLTTRSFGQRTQQETEARLAWIVSEYFWEDGYWLNLEGGNNNTLTLIKGHASLTGFFVLLSHFLADIHHVASESSYMCEITYNLIAITFRHYDFVRGTFFSANETYTWINNLKILVLERREGKWKISALAHNDLFIIPDLSNPGMVIRQTHGRVLERDSCNIDWYFACKESREDCLDALGD